MYRHLKGGFIMNEEYNLKNLIKSQNNTERKNHMTTKIQKWGNSQGIRLPKYLLESIDWKDNEQINIKTEEGKIILEKTIKEKRKNIKELFAEFDDQYTPIDIDWGKPIGKEIW